jgi:hypothetical protein
MIEIPLHIFIFIYVIFLGIFGFFFVVNVLHMVGTGTFTRPVLLLTISLTAAALMIFEMTGEVLATVDLSQPLTFNLKNITSRAGQTGVTNEIPD